MALPGWQRIQTNRGADPFNNLWEIGATDLTSEQWLGVFEPSALDETLLVQYPLAALCQVCVPGAKNRAAEHPEAAHQLAGSRIPLGEHQ
jgi:hypothetical protein